MSDRWSRRNSNDSPALFAVADLHQVRVYVRAPEPYAAALKNGLTATLQLPEYPGRKFEAKIETTSHAIDKKSRSLLVELIADNPDGALSPGAFARVHFQLPPDPNAVTIPANALVFRDNAIEVATLGVDNHILMKKVRIARDLGSEVEIAGGLSVDERIVTNPPESLGNGEEVRLADGSGPSSSAPAGQQGAGAAGSKSPKMAETERGGGE